MELDALYSILLNLIPIGIFSIPIFFLFKNEIGRRIYLRLYTALCIFFLVYWVLPSVFQFTAKDLPINSSDEGNYGLGAVFLLSRSISLVLLFAQYPFVLLPFIFIISPLLSFIVLYRRIRTDQGSLSEKLAQLTYEYKQSPREFILQSLRNKDWRREKDLFKAFLILLPISLYLLTVILDIAGLDPVNIDQSETALGWFIEILFVYIATFLTGFQLLASSQISYKGRFIGEQIQSRLFESLIQVGTPIAVLSVLLFIAQKTESLMLILYFFAYFLMAAFIYVMLIRVFEPVSILLFFKLVNLWKIRHASGRSKYKMDFENGLNIGFFALVAGVLSIIGVFIQWFINDFLQSQVPNGNNVLELAKINQEPDFYIAHLIENLSAISSATAIIFMVIMGVFFALSLKQNKNIGISLLIYGGILTIFTIIFNFAAPGNWAPLNFGADLAWITGSPVRIQIFGFDFITMRTAFLTADLTGSPVLLVLAIPFLILRPFTNFMLWGLFLYFIDKKFLSKTFSRENNLTERVTFTSSTMPLFDKFKRDPDVFIIIGGNFSVGPDGIWSESQIQLINQIKSGVKLDKLYPVEENGKRDEKKMVELYKTFKSLKAANIPMQWWSPEFSYVIQRAKLDGLYVLYQDGRDLLYFNFNPEAGISVEPELVSGMFSAITSFIQETTRSSDYLRAIDQGQKKVILEYSHNLPVFSAIFADRETIEIRKALADFLKEFCEKHDKVLVNWLGDMNPFAQDHKLVETYFAEFL